MLKRFPAIYSTQLLMALIGHDMHIVYAAYPDRRFPEQVTLDSLLRKLPDPFTQFGIAVSYGGVSLR